MINLIISKKEFTGWLKRLSQTFQLLVPVQQGETSHFAPWTEGTEPDFSLPNTRLSPKGLVQPPSEGMFRFTSKPEDSEAHMLKEIPGEDSPRLAVGIRPCDARAFNLVEINFINPQYEDPWWRRARERLALVGLGCNQPCSTCFCTSVGGGPFDTSGLDVLLTDLGEAYLARAVTGRGEDLLKATGIGREATDQEREQAGRVQKTAEEELPAQVPVDRLKAQPLLPLFEAPFWQEVQFACINCGTCTFLCPTCWCFDIQDEVQDQEGCRLRNWDSCMFPLFTLHGSGHNPRGEKVQRVRQRFMHKLKYYVDKYENGVACVGCGRCIQFCPVNIDIRQVCRQMNEFEAK